MRAALPLLIAATCLMSGCPKERRSVTVTLVQYDEVEIPLVGRGVMLYLGDVSGGNSAEVRIKGPKGEPIAVEFLAEHDEFAFDHGGKTFVVTAVEYENNYINDEATLRIEQRAPSRRPRNLRVPQRSSDQLLPGVFVTIGDVESSDRADLTVFAGNAILVPPTIAKAGDTFDFDHDGVRYRLTVTAFEGHTASDDYALLQLDTR